MVAHLLDLLVNFVTSVIGSIGYVGIVVLMAAESANIPIPSEAIMPFAGFLVARGDMNFVGVVLSGTLGNWVGSSLSWWIGATGGRTLVDRYGRFIRLNHQHLDLAEQWFAKRGELSVLFGRLLPIVRTFISLPAGLARMNFATFSTYTIAGSLPFCVLLTYFGVVLGERWESIRPYFRYADYVVVGAIVIGILYLVLRRKRT